MSSREAIFADPRTTDHSFTLHVGWAFLSKQNKSARRKTQLGEERRRTEDERQIESLEGSWGTSNIAGRVLTVLGPEPVGVTTGILEE